MAAPSLSSWSTAHTSQPRGRISKWRNEGERNCNCATQPHLSVFTHFQLSSFLHLLTTLIFNWHLRYHLLMVGSVLGDDYHLPVILFARRPDIGLRRWLSGKESTSCQCRRRSRLKFNPRVEKMPWRRKWQPTPVLLPEKSQVTESSTTEHTHAQRWEALSPPTLSCSLKMILGKPAWWMS